MSSMDLIRSGYIRELLESGKRLESRGIDEFRRIVIKCNTLGNAEGSAQVDVGNTKVLAGVKMVVEEPHSDTPDEGNFIVSAELLPVASAEYDVGPPSPSAIELARVIDRGIRAGNCIDLKSLSIDKESVWSVYVDLYVLNYDGNLFDAGTLAVMSALAHTRIPKFENEEIVHTADDKPLKIENTVVSTTFCKVGDKIILDPNGAEESAMSTRLTIATDGLHIRAMQKGLSGSFSIDEINNLVDLSFSKYEELKKQINATLDK